MFKYSHNSQNQCKNVTPSDVQLTLDKLCSIFYYFQSDFMFFHRIQLTRVPDIPMFAKYTYLQNKRMRRCGVAPPPIIFERLKLPQQIIYRRKENLSESPNHQKYWENILVSRFYEQFSRNRRNLGHFRKFEKISNS